MFFKIPGLSDNRYLIYAYITYIFYGMMYTGVNIPYGSLASVITCLLYTSGIRYLIWIYRADIHKQNENLGLLYGGQSVTRDSGQY